MSSAKTKTPSKRSFESLLRKTSSKPSSKPSSKSPSKFSTDSSEAFIWFEGFEYTT